MRDHRSRRDRRVLRLPRVRERPPCEKHCRQAAKGSDRADRVLIYQVFGFTGIFACCGALQLRLGLTERVGNSRGGLVSGIRRGLFAAIKSRTGLAYGMFGSLRRLTSREHVQKLFCVKHRFPPMVQMAA